MCNLANLEKINLSHNPLKILPDCFGYLANLKSLLIDYTAINLLPDSFCNLKLEYFKLTHVFFKSFPLSITKISTLKVLDISKCSIRGEIPEDVKLLSNLEKLDISKNYISSVNLEYLPDALVEFLAESNKITNFCGSYPSIKQKENLQVIDLGNNKLKEFPLFFTQLKSLIKLNLYSNRISDIPTSIGSLVNLERLNLSVNSIKTLPDSIGELQSLVDLNLFRNKLSMLPSSIGMLSNLRLLNLMENELNSLPTEICNLSRLRNIVLRKNNLSDIPGCISNLVNLESIALDDNPLDKMPALKSAGLSEIFLILNQQNDPDTKIYTIQIDKELKYAFKQFLLLFSDYVKLTKNRAINVHVQDIPVGLLMSIKLTGDVTAENVKNYLIEYGDFIKDSSNDWHIKIENTPSVNYNLLYKLVLSIKNVTLSLVKTAQLRDYHTNNSISNASDLNEISLQNKELIVRNEMLERMLGDRDGTIGFLQNTLYSAINNSPSTVYIPELNIYGGKQQFADTIENRGLKHGN